MLLTQERNEFKSTDPPTSASNLSIARTTQWRSQRAVVVSRRANTVRVLMMRGRRAHHAQQHALRITATAVWMQRNTVRSVRNRGEEARTHHIWKQHVHTSPCDQRTLGCCLKTHQCAVLAAVCSRASAVPLHSTIGDAIWYGAVLSCVKHGVMRRGVTRYDAVLRGRQSTDWRHCKVSSTESRVVCSARAL